MFVYLQMIEAPEERSKFEELYLLYFASYYDLMIDATGRSSVTKTINNEPHTMETDAVTIYIY